MALKPSIESRRRSAAEISRLEHSILQAVNDHISEQPLRRSQIILALINVAGYWQKKTIFSDLSKELHE